MKSLLKWVKKNLDLKAEVPNERPAKLESTSWKSFELIYDPDKESLLVECQRDTGARSLCRQTVQGELGSLEEVPDSKHKKRVVDCLKQTRFIVECRVDADDDHEEAFTVRQILDFFVDKCGAIIDEEDVGFFACSDSPLRLRV
jgi:hypothetical protein